MARHRFFNMYLTTTISVALVLFLVGVECIILLSARELIKQVKENVSLTLIISDQATDEEINRIDNLLTISPFSREHSFISKEEALREHIEYLGEDPVSFLGYNPLESSFEVYLQADYAQSDSILSIEHLFSTFPSVSRIVYQKDVIDMLDNNVGLISVGVLVATLLLLFVALALIVNTIRLHVYSKRFLINTMKLVGATPRVIRLPIIGRNVLIGFIAAILALLMLIAVITYILYNFGINLLMLSWQNAVIVVAIVLLSGILITLVASLFATNRYIRMKTDDLYYV